MDNGVTREHDSYMGQAIKQADVNLLAYPLKSNYRQKPNTQRFRVLQRQSALQRYPLR